MKNKFEIHGETTVIYLQRGMSTIIDTVDLQKVCEFPNQWCAHKSTDTETWYCYGRTTVNGKRKRTELHRWITNALYEKLVDHVDHDGLNNRRETNLRLVTQSQNQQNRKGTINKTGFRGVYPARDKFKVEVVIEGNKKYLGLYDSPELASEVAIEARRRLMPFSQEPGQKNDELWDEISKRYLKLVFH